MDLKPIARYIDRQRDRQRTGNNDTGMNRKIVINQRKKGKHDLDRISR